MTGDIDHITNKELATLLPEVSAIARDAGAVIMQFYNAAGKSGSADFIKKADGTPVTEADKKSSALIETRLSQITPGIMVVSEENGVCPPEGTVLYWTIDPLDGTKEFINRTDGFAINIALMDENVPVLGVVYSPVFNDMYHGLRGGLATRQTGNKTPRAISVRSTDKYDLRVLFNAAHADEQLYAEQRTLFASRGIVLPQTPVSYPSLPRNLRVAEGLADLYIMTGNRIADGGGYGWDNAADWLILTNAGGEMRRLTDGAPVTFPEPRQRMPAYVAIGDKNLGKKLFPEI